MPAAKSSTIPLPTRWTNHVRSALLQVIGLAQYATVYTRSWAASSRNARVRLKAENDRLQQEVALLREEIRIKDNRLLRIDPHKLFTDRTDGHSAIAGRPWLVAAADG